MNKLKILSIIIIGTLITMFPALVNGFPLIYFDSDTYINLAIKLAPNKTNLFGYGIFIWLFSFKSTLWTVIFTQSFILNLLIYSVLRNFFSEKLLLPYYLLIVGFLSLFSGFSWFSSMIMADIFVPITILSTYMFMKETISKKMLFFLGSIILVFSSMHISIVLMLLLISILFIIRTLIYKAKLISSKKQLYKSILLSVPFLLLIITKSNDFFRKDPNKKGVAHVFIMAKLIENGILDSYLEKNCATHNYKLCKYIDKFPDLPSSFVWEENSPLYKTDGWKDTDGEYSEIITDIFTTPYYIGLLTYKALISGIRQVFNYDIELIPISDKSTVYNTLNKNMKHEIKKLRTSKQFKGSLDLTFVNFIQNILIIFGLIVSVIVLINKKSKFYNLTLMLFSGVVFNALVSGAVSNVVNRYQARVAWLLIFIVLLVVIEKLNNIVPSFKQKH